LRGFCGFCNMNIASYRGGLQFPENSIQHSHE
jgi:hypothetical protein